MIHATHSSFSISFPMPPPLYPQRVVLLTADDVDAECIKGSTSSRKLAQCNACVDSMLTVALCSVENTCYNCHPGKNTKCWRGAMGAADMFCQGCHGNLAQVGDDFSGDLELDNPFPDGADLSRRVPWANEPTSSPSPSSSRRPMDSATTSVAATAYRRRRCWWTVRTCLG